MKKKFGLSYSQFASMRMTANRLKKEEAAKKAAESREKWEKKMVVDAEVYSWTAMGMRPYPNGIGEYLEKRTVEKLLEEADRRGYERAKEKYEKIAELAKIEASRLRFPDTTGS